MAFNPISHAADREFDGGYPSIAERWRFDPRTATEEERKEAFRVPLVESPEQPALVSLLSDDSPEQQALYEKHDGDLMTGVPTIALTLGGKPYFLTWAEAYNLGHALKQMANIAFYG